MLETQEDKLKRGIARLIDSYAQEYIDQEEFEPRIKAMKQNLKMVEEQKKKIFDQKKLTQELTLVVRACPQTGMFKKVCQTEKKVIN